MILIRKYFDKLHLVCYQNYLHEKTGCAHLVSPVFLHVKAQFDNSKYQQQYQLKNKKATDAIKIDGILNEVSWQNAEPIKNFWQKEPLDTGHARHSSIIL